MGPSRHEIYTERLIREAQEQGKFDNLANQGKPLKIPEENPYLDEEWRLAFQVLETGGFCPPWIELEKEIEGEIERTHRDREEHIRWLRRRLNDIKLGSTYNFIRDLRRLRQSHQYFLKAHTQKLYDLNKKIEQFNSSCPVTGLQKLMYRPEELIHKFDQECPAIPEL
jgi:hypothetical protein